MISGGLKQPKSALPKPNRGRSRSLRAAKSGARAGHAAKRACFTTTPPKRPRAITLTRHFAALTRCHAEPARGLSPARANLEFQASCSHILLARAPSPKPALGRGGAAQPKGPRAGAGGASTARGAAKDVQQRRPRRRAFVGVHEPRLLEAKLRIAEARLCYRESVGLKAAPKPRGCRPCTARSRAAAGPRPRRGRRPRPPR